MQETPICPLCKIRECGRSDEGGSEMSYFSTCTECLFLSGYRDHGHTHYPSPAQVAAGTYREGQSWRTSETVRPIWEDGVHVGFRCGRFDLCGWEHRFTPEELQPCEHDNGFGFPVKTIKGVCRNYQSHRQQRGECDERGYITEYGREQEQLRSDAANWDPGRYIEL